VSAGGVVRVRMTAADLAENQSVGTAVVAGGPTLPPGNTVSRFQPVTPPGTVEVPPVPPAITMTPPVSPPPVPAPVPAPVPMPAPLATTTPPAPFAPTSPSSVVPASSGLAGSVTIVSKRQVKLDFEVAKYGPSGVGSVDVYVTHDDGRTWSPEPMKLDPSAVTLPMDTNATGPLKGSVALQLDKEGVPHGFYLIVKSRAGLGKAPPRPGDLPHLRVELDTTAPFAELYKPEPDSARPTMLRLTWKAEDRRLAASPITIEWAPRKEGPWQFIGRPELPNTGEFLWEVTRDVPPSVFLRLTVRDAAGNSAVAQTPDTILVDLSVQEISNVGLQMGR
jgi:hypothetical protein